MLAAQYESWLLPLAVILVVPLGLLGVVAGVNLRGTDNNVYTQIGVVLIIALASKNAILIVEFARELRLSGRGLREAAIEASRLRFRPIVMTSFAFILGVVPLVFATGAGAASRQALGTAVFGGMITATVLAVFFVPVFYLAVQGLIELINGPPKPHGVAELPVATGRRSAGSNGSGRSWQAWHSRARLAANCRAGRNRIHKPKRVPAPHSPAATPMSRVIWLTLLAAVFANPAHAADKPNVVVFLVDDLGAFDLGCTRNPLIETPHIDRLAAEGVRFTTAYSACTVCSPTRAALLTGQYPGGCTSRIGSRGTSDHSPS